MALKPSRPVVERFQEKITKTGSCWVWNACRNANGYGLINVEGKSTIASRLSYHIHKGEVPLHLDVLHTCDNPPCVNPDHLYLGTASENMKDAYRRNRRKPSRKLTQEQVNWIRANYDGKWGSATIIAKRFNVTYRAITLIARHERWRNVEGQKAGIS